MDVKKLEKAIKIIRIIYTLLFIAGIAGGGLYILINFLSPSLSMANVNGVLQKDTSWIIITSSFIWAPCLVFAVCLKTLEKNLINATRSIKNEEWEM